MKITIERGETLFGQCFGCVQILLLGPNWGKNELLTKLQVIDNKTYLSLRFHLSRINMRIKVDKRGRFVLPKRLRKKYGVQEGFRLIVTESMGRICLFPVKTYEKPTEALYGSLNIDKPVEEPNSLAREYIRKKAFEDML